MLSEKNRYNWGSFWHEFQTRFSFISFVFVQNKLQAQRPNQSLEQDNKAVQYALTAVQIYKEHE